MIGDPRETQVLQAVVALVDSLLADFDVVELLTDLTEHCVRLLDVAAAGLLLADPAGQLHLMAATSTRTEDLELFQLQSQQGPCLDCYRTGLPVSVADLRAATDTWPEFAAAAARGGFVSVHAIPMRAAGTVLGALGLFGNTPGELNGPDLAVGQTLAHIASVAIVQEHAPDPRTVPPRVVSALHRQILVEQARGFVHDRLDVPMDHALTLLRTYARRDSSHLSDLCRALMSEQDRRAVIVAGMSAIRDGLTA